jgi:4-amino-4-deoxychorismate lyase
LSLWLINGEACQGLSPLDRGLAYGDGLFETLAIIRGRISLWDLHLQRLALGCDRLGLSCPDAGLLHCEVQSLSGQETGVAKIILTRGQGAVGYLADPQQAPTRLVGFRTHPQLPPAREIAPIRARICQTRLAIQPRLAGIKHLNRLEQVLARQEWTDPSIGEGLMLDSEGFLVEGISSNLFLLEGERLITPLLDRCGVAGTLRRLVMTLAPQLGLEVVEERLLPERALQAEALGVCNALTGLSPLASLDSTDFKPSRHFTQLTALVWDAAFQ